MNHDSQEYYRELAMHLRNRRLPESRVSSILTGVAEGVQESGNPPEEEFGKAKDYAEQFPVGTSRPSSWWAVRLLALHVGVSFAIVFSLSRRQDQANPELFGMSAWLYPVAAVVVLVLVGVSLHMRLPRGFRAPSDGTA